MSHFAQIVDGIVQQVIVAEHDFIDQYSKQTEGEWIQTSYNTRGGEHPENRPLRKNFAGKGYTYDAQRDAFIPPKPFDSWVLNEESCLWESPVAKPTEPARYGYDWDEGNVQWIPADPPNIPMKRVDFLLALEDAGLLDGLESYIEASAPKRVRLYWNNADVFERNRNEVKSLLDSNAITIDQLDETFGITVNV